MPMESCHIWLGYFPSEEVFERYFQENYDDDEEYDELYRTSDDDEGDDEDAADAELHEQEASRDVGSEYESENVDELPINKFAEEQGETFYDDDRVEYSFHASGDLRILLKGHTSANAYTDRVIAFTESQQLGEINTFILADRDEFEAPHSVRGDGYMLWYIGEFSCHT